MLRFDLPVLDELFAWSDPPKQTASSPTLPPHGATTRPPALPTALQPEQLADSWQASRNRMALTRTQDAEVTDGLMLAKTSPDDPQPHRALRRSVKAEVHPDALEGWGEYALATVKYSKDRAAEGLGGDKAVPFYIDGSQSR
ncbi:hypothetical protein [Rhizobium sp. CCGE531]|uniref:hypothetical protein n=1 Tax=Rhizobium sp. CCGE531 TaxID=2364271 RepID=UPI000EA9A115|nr:hypothetical protein [Rhizobium sp. CCGE531]AYG66122.1 hypothetical protein CCGE531_09070 [Rhizobium sp. CCGE531]